MIVCGRAEVELHSFLILVVGGGQWSALNLSCVKPGDGVPGTQAGWVISKAGWDNLEKNKSFALGTLDVHSVA